MVPFLSFLANMAFQFLKYILLCPSRVHFCMLFPLPEMFVLRSLLKPFAAFRFHFHNFLLKNMFLTSILPPIMFSHSSMRFSVVAFISVRIFMVFKISHKVNIVRAMFVMCFLVTIMFLNTSKHCLAFSRHSVNTC